MSACTWYNISIIVACYVLTNMVVFVGMLEYVNTHCTRRERHDRIRARYYPARFTCGASDGRIWAIDAQRKERTKERVCCNFTCGARNGRSWAMEPSPPAQCKEQRTKEIAGNRVCTIACVLSSATKQCGDRIRLLRPILVL